LKDSEPLTRGEKSKIATEDAFDRGTFALAALFAGESQLTNANRSFGQGAAGYGRYFATSFADFAIGDYMTEAIYPSLLHQDPRYFRRGTGTGWSRLSYAAGQIFWTMETQAIHSSISRNSSETQPPLRSRTLIISDNRTASNAVSKLGVTTRCRYGSQYPEGVLARLRTQIQSKTPPGCHPDGFR
jgi:hypothetical protein